MTYLSSQSQDSVPALQGADPATRAWWRRVLALDLDEVFLSNLLVLRETLADDLAEGTEDGNRRVTSLRAMAARLDPEGVAARRLETKAQAVESLMAEMTELHRTQPRPPGDRGTAQTRVRRHGSDPIGRMAEAGQLDDAQVEAARRLRRVVESVTRPVMARSPRIDGLHGLSSASGSDRLLDLMPGELAWEHARLYLPWAKEVGKWSRRGGYRPVDLVLDVVVMELGLDSARRKHRCALDTARMDLRDALRLYARRAGIGRYRHQRPLDH